MRLLVTGSNRGIGAEITRQLRAAGAEVVATSRHSDPPLDVTRADDIAAVAAHVARLGGLDGLVNNAGVALSGFDGTVVRRTLAVNFYGVLHLTEALMPHLHPGARIVGLSSGLADRASLPEPLRRRFADPRLTRDGVVALMEEFQRRVDDGSHRAHGWPSSAYRVSKLGLDALTQVWAREGWRADSACPGWVQTDMGGFGAPTPVEEGADTPVWLALRTEGPTGGFWRDRRPAAW